MPEVVKQPVDQAIKDRAAADSSSRIQSMFEGMYEQQLLKYQDAEDKKGLKFELPELPLPPGSHLKHRYEPIVDQFTNLLMVDGKKATARRVSSSVQPPIEEGRVERLTQSARMYRSFFSIFRLRQLLA